MQLRKDVSPTYSHIKMVTALPEPGAPTESGGYNFLFAQRLGDSARGFGLWERVHSRLNRGSSRASGSLSLRIGERAAPTIF